MSIEIPADWNSLEVKDPRVFNVGNQGVRLVVLREPKKEMGVENLAEYFEFKFEKISDGWQDMRVGKRNTFMLHGRESILIDGSATVHEPKTLATTFYCMTVEGADYYYLAYLVNLMKGDQGMEDLRRILETLKVP